MSLNINQLSAVDSLQASDLFPIWSNSNGDTRKSSITVLQAFMQANLTFESSTAQQQYTTQYSAPSATAFSVQITDGSDNIHLILTPVATYATGTIVLPLVTNLTDKQEVLVNSTQEVTTLTIDKNGATALTGAPTTLAANAFFRLRYDEPTKTWYRVG